MCRPEESVYLEHGVQQKQSIYEGLVLKLQESESAFGGPAALAPPRLCAPCLPFWAARAPLSWLVHRNSPCPEAPWPRLKCQNVSAQILDGPFKLKE